MFWTFTMLVSAFALGIAAYRRWPEDGCLNALADVAEAPFQLIKGMIAKAKDGQTPAPVAGTPTGKRSPEKPAA
jgi:hypothetical protein